MKKTFLFLVAIAFIGFVLSSCRVHERCPAYGKVEKEKVEKPV